MNYEGGKKKENVKRLDGWALFTFYVSLFTSYFLLITSHFFLRLIHLPPAMSEIRMKAMAMPEYVLMSVMMPMVRKTRPRIKNIADILRRSNFMLTSLVLRCRFRIRHQTMRMVCCIKSSRRNQAGMN